MSKHLLIVESPAKAKTLHKYLGKDFEVMASYGHVRDLIPKNGAVNTQDDFSMHYEIIERNARHVNEITKAAKAADSIYLATDPDREGEAISWHLHEILNERGVLNDKKVYRVAFHEITKNAIQNAVSHPRGLEMDLVNAQQARRALDYLVGFNLSPLLWRKVRPGLSAGRVQSPALRMIVEREREIEAFKSEEYWDISAALEHNKQEFPGKLVIYNNEKVKKFSFTNATDTHKAIETLKKTAKGILTVADVAKKDSKRHPAPPFTTSTMQQAAANKLYFGAQKTMRTAQRLYEEGHITYMRTDSVNLAQEAISAIRHWVNQQYGATYLPEKPRIYKTKSKNAQEAHEAIRPTDCARDGNAIGLSGDELKLYELIRKRAVASQMASAVLENVSAELHAGSAQHQFRATGSTIKFPGFISVYQEEREDTEDDDNRLLPAMKIGDRLQLLDIIGNQHFTQPPPRYSEAALIKELEANGIGRPSTYASIISTLQEREYVEQENRRFIPTTIGKVVNDFLTKHFERYVDYDFTARLEDDLDAVSRGEREWKPLLGDFWGTFSHQIDEKKEIPREEVMQARELGTDPKTGKPVTVRFGRFGPFVQIGSKEDEEKPQFASIPADRNMDDITLEEALELFKLPRLLGNTEEDGDIVTNVGRFGPYVRFGRRYVSLPKDEDPLTISLERALELIAEKKELDSQKYIKEIKNGEEILQVLNGRFGPYVTNGSINASIPKTIEPATLDLNNALELLEKAKARKAKRSATSKGKTTSGTTKKSGTTTRKNSRSKATTKTKESKPT
ncbi:MAG: type I DNA topoisomerase [Cardiobacteriaceae bacterium]|nr:type I DNA topoisomerase [Cardiobacteriaceae bacterium]